MSTTDPAGTSASETAGPPADSRQRRLRLLTIFGIAAIAGLTMLTTTQNWWTLHLEGHTVPVPGSSAAPALTSLALCGLALAAALAIAGPVIRLVLGIIQLFIAFTIVLSSIQSLSDPEQSSASLMTTATGISGDASLRKLIESVSYTPWGSLAIVVGVLTFLAGIWLLATFRFWPLPSRKYQTARFAVAGGPRDAVVDWDALSGGEDPTDDEVQPTDDPESSR
jgi:Tryptophan-associated transmembrane protein (Trp_oprn_chp)